MDVHISIILVQIQKNEKLKSDPKNEQIKTTVSRVLAASQIYMRNRKVSFDLIAQLYFIIHRMSVVLLVSEMWREQ